MTESGWRKWTSKSTELSKVTGDSGSHSEQAMGFRRGISSPVQVRPAQVLVLPFSDVLCCKDRSLSKTEGSLLCLITFSFRKMLLWSCKSRPRGSHPALLCDRDVFTHGKTGGCQTNLIVWSLHPQKITSFEIPKTQLGNMFLPDPKHIPAELLFPRDGKAGHSVPMLPSGDMERVEGGHGSAPALGAAPTRWQPGDSQARPWDPRSAPLPGACSHRPSPSSICSSLLTSWVFHSVGLSTDPSSPGSKPFLSRLSVLGFSPS